MSLPSQGHFRFTVETHTLSPPCKQQGISDVGVIVSTIPPEGHVAIPASLLAGNPIMLDASYLPGGAPLTKRAVEAGCEVIVGPHMLFEQATYQVMTSQ